jgi:hypothetical protein
MAITVAVQAKSLVQSKTAWINLIVALLAIIGELQAILPEFTDILAFPPSVTRWLLFGTAVLNIILRRISDQPVRGVTNPTEPVVLPAAGTTPKL